jgi:hypothetical protein
VSETVSELVPLFNLLAGFDHRNVVALDRAHNMFLIGAVMARKPLDILELGIGSAYVTMSLMYAIRYNQRGRLTSVDNWADWGGQEPPGVDALRKGGANIVTMGEEAFVRAAASDSYDLLVSDADHFRSAGWLDQHLRIVRHDGFMFFHDTNSLNAFPGLATIERRIGELGLPCFHFKESSRPDERCDRGWLFVINKKTAAEGPI